MSSDPTLPGFVAPGGRFGRVPDPAALPRIEGKWVHKIQWRNVLLSRVDRIGEDEYEGELVPDWDHPFFFEHPLDHVPSMMLVETGRQLGIAIAHMHLGVPLGVVFITTDYRIDFTAFAEVASDKPIVWRAKIGDKTWRHDRLSSLHLDGTCFQAGRDLGGMSGTFTFYDREVYVRLRRMAAHRAR